jgi:DNA repair protein RadC
MIKEIKVLTVSEESAENYNSDLLNSPEKAKEFFQSVIEKCSWFDPEKECFVVLILDRKNRIKTYNLISLGSQSGTFCGPREVFRAAIISAGAAIICIHNHPSGDPAPSANDISATRQLRECAKILDIALLDHIIIGKKENDPVNKGFYSFREAGLV